jgi:hypothetical protein
MSSGDVAAIAASPTTQDVRKRWLLLAAALLVGLVAAFAIGSAVKKTSAPAPSATLAPSGTGSAQHASITPLTSAGALPVLHAPPPKPKPKAKVKATTTPATSSSSTGSVAPSSGTTAPSTGGGTTAPSTGGGTTAPSTGGGTTAPSTGGGSSAGGGTTGVSHSGGGGGG